MHSLISKNITCHMETPSAEAMHIPIRGEKDVCSIRNMTRRQFRQNWYSAHKKGEKGQEDKAAPFSSLATCL